MKWLGDNEDLRVCEENKKKIEHDLQRCEAGIDKQKSNFWEKINNLESNLQLAQDNVRLLESERDKCTLNEQKKEKLNADLDQCQREKEHLQGNLTAKQLEVVMLSSNYSVCEEYKTKTEHKLNNCEADIDELKSSFLKKINTLEERLQLAQDNIHLLQRELDKCTLNEQRKEKLNANLEQCQREKEYLQGNLTAKQLEVVMLSLNYSVCLNKLETCTGHLSTSKANLQDKTQQYESCLKAQTREKNQKDQCNVSLSKCELQAGYVIRDYSTCTSKLNKCDKDLKTCEERHCFGFKY